jgi:hypothetical protein
VEDDLLRNKLPHRGSNADALNGKYMHTVTRSMPILERALFSSLSASLISPFPLSVLTEKARKAAQLPHCFRWGVPDARQPPSASSVKNLTGGRTSLAYSLSTASVSLSSHVYMPHIRIHRTVHNLCSPFAMRRKRGKVLEK